MNPTYQRDKIPNSCSVCKTEIELYKPYYTIAIHPHFMKQPKDFSLETVFCPDCFKAYEDFLIEREVITNHINTMRDIKNV